MPDSCDGIDCSPPGSSSMGFPRQEYWSGLSFPPPGDLPDPGIEPVPPALAGGFFTAESLGLKKLTFEVESTKFTGISILSTDCRLNILVRMPETVGKNIVGGFLEFWDNDVLQKNEPERLELLWQSFKEAISRL